MAIRVRDLMRQIAMEHEIQIMSGKVGRGHIHLFISYLPHQNLSNIVQWLKGTSSSILANTVHVSLPRGKKEGKRTRDTKS